MAKRKRPYFPPQPMDKSVKERFQQLIGKKDPEKVKRKVIQVQAPKRLSIDRKYSAISINQNYENEADLIL